MKSLDIFRDTSVIFWQTVPDRLWPRVIEHTCIHGRNGLDYLIHSDEKILPFWDEKAVHRYDEVIAQKFSIQESDIGAAAEVLTHYQFEFLKHNGEQNVIFLPPGLVMTLWYKTVLHREEKRWHIFLWERPEHGVWPDWGNYRERNTRYLEFRR